MSELSNLILNNCLYKTFINTYFRSVQVIGLDRVPLEGPVLICANHNNQFFDAVLIQSILNSGNTGFIMAAKSYRQPIIGFFGKMMGSIPVERPQDLAKNGTGFIQSIKGDRIRGLNTVFSKELKEQFTFSLKIGTEKHELLVKEILSDEECILIQPYKGNDAQNINAPFKVIPKLDQGQMFQQVWDALNKEKRRIIIFPEGGSHDQTNLLPLKPGICIMALGAMQQSNQPVKIVSVGLNYYKGHKFRSKVLIEFGHPYQVPMELLDLYKNNKREAVSLLLRQVENQMREVLYFAPTYKELSAIILARKIYLPDDQRLTGEQELEINKRFSKGYTKFIGDVKVKEFFNKVIQYRKDLTDIGIEDYQLKTFQKNFIQDFFAFIKFFVLSSFSLAFALPGIIANTPIGILIKYLSEKERVKCLKNSTVKLKGNDVVASYRVLLTFKILPIYWLLTSFIIYLLSKKFFAPNNSSKQKLITVLYMLFSPLYAYIMLKSTDKVFRYGRNLKSRIMLLFTYDRIKALSQTRKQLQAQVRQLVDVLGKEVVENFEENRIAHKDKLIKKQENVRSPSRFNIFKQDKFEIPFEDLVEIGI